MRRLRNSLVVSALILSACASPYVQPAGLVSMPPSASGDPVDGQMMIRVSDGAMLPVQVWAPLDAFSAPESVGAVIIGVHGFNDHSSTFDAAGRWWSDRGIVTYAYDQRGFGMAPEPGTWPGKRRLVQDLEDVVGALRERHPGKPLFVHGNSMGGAVVLIALARREPGSALSSIAGVSLTAPAVWGGPAMSPFYRLTLWAAAHTIPSRRLTGRGLGVIPSDNIDMLRALGRDPLVIKETRVDSLYGLVKLMGAAQRVTIAEEARFLVLYGAKDRIIPRRPTAALAAKMNGSGRFAVYPNGYHMLLRDLQAEVVWRDILAWIDDPSAALPSGAEVSGSDLFAAVTAD
ncbi:MAG: alpha/beta hydrolase [Alphaproteobacteria bacterium]|nr:alpha/beta hydrolase [Alphaproteobacteria bacterium]